MTLIPKATYAAPDLTREFVPGPGPHSTNGKTTQISDIVIKAGGEDRDRPSDAKDSELDKNKAKENEDLERRILDDGVDEDDSD
ncbi:hypothetical protein QCA50_015701 [Cerrena zonata]|uniref:EKC/KEOPS complex subunit GON7 n=1 Tax=Cerrena zonata TaxID=2478898 RepID=A0AAW0FJS2_9APHY